MIDKMNYTMHVNRESCIGGMRQKLSKCLWFPKQKGKESELVRRGVLSALYSFRANFLPNAYLREESIWQLEQEINECIRNLEDYGGNHVD